MATGGIRPLTIGLHLPEVERVARWSELAEMCRIAEEVGFDAIWVPDHLIYEFPGQEKKAPWEGWSVLSAVAAITNRVQIGPLVLCTNFRNPALIAKMADTVDEISGGRLILGLGAGWHEPEYRAFGFPYDERFGRFLEAFTIIRTLLRDGAIDHDGKYFTLRECELRPRGPRPQGPPLMIGSRGDQVLRHTLPHVDSWNAWFRWTGNTIEGIAPYREQVDRIAREVGRDPATIERTVAALINFDDAVMPLNPENPPITGSDEELAAYLRGYATAGVSHVQVVIDPNTPAGVERFGRVLELLDKG